jgi:hypothetical protein
MLPPAYTGVNARGRADLDGAPIEQAASSGPGVALPYFISTGA